MRFEERRYDPQSAEGRRRILSVAHRAGARNGPPAFTEYHIRPRWRTGPRDGVCVVEFVEVDVQITILLPYGVSSGVERWLRRHEDGHRRIVEEHVARLHADLRDDSAPGCPALQLRIDRRLEVADRELERAHARYDGVGELPEAPDGI